MEEAAKGALRRPDRAHGTAGKSGRKSARPGSACLHCLSLHGSVAPTYSGVLPTRAAVQCRRSSSAPPPAPPAPSCPLPPAAAPPSPPRPLIPPGLPPPSVCGGEGGALTGGALWVPCSWAGGGGASVACVMGPPTCAILGRVSRLGYTSRARRYRAASYSARKDPSAAHQRDGMPPRSVRAELLERPFATNGQQHSRTPGNGIPACASSTGGRAGAPRAAHSFAAFPLCIALPQLLHSPMVAPWLRRGASLCSGGAAQAPQLVKPGKNPVYPSNYHGNRA